VQRLAQDLSAKKSARQQELEANLGRRDNAKYSKALWEESWMKESAARVEKKNSKKMEVLIAWRSNEIDGLIRRSLLNRGTHESSDDPGVQLTASHATGVTALNESIRKQQTVNKEIKDKLATIDISKAALRSRVSKVEEDLSFAESKLKDITCDTDRKKLQHASIMDETSTRIEGNIQAIVRRRCEIEKELKDATEKYRRELRRVMVASLAFCCLFSSSRLNRRSYRKLT